MKLLENILAVIGLLALILGAVMIVLTLEKVTEPCPFSIQQCGYGMSCMKAQCYRGNK